MCETLWKKDVKEVQSERKWDFSGLFYSFQTVEGELLRIISCEGVIEGTRGQTLTGFANWFLLER